MRYKIIFLITIGLTRVMADVSSSIAFPEPSQLETNPGDDEHNHKSEEHPSEGAMSYYVANLGLRMLRDLLATHTNVIVSPLNIYSCLGMINLGAVGGTKAEIRNVLGTKRVNQSIGAIAEATAGVKYASALFINHDVVPKADFVNSAALDYQGSVIKVNISNGEQTKDSINRWVAGQTNGTIQNLLQGFLDPDLKMIVISVLLFRGKWLRSFSPAATNAGKFNIDENSFIDVQLMHLAATVPLVRNSYLDAIGLPYQGEGMMMYLILPKSPGVSALKKLLSHLNVNSLKKLKKESTNQEIIIVIPKLTLDGRFSLKKPLKQMGISSMFDPTKANFTNSAENASGLYVSDVYHNVYFEINEEGTTASAATASILTKSTKYVFRATRPFIFVITNPSDIVLFMGAITNP